MQDGNPGLKILMVPWDTPQDQALLLDQFAHSVDRVVGVHDPAMAFVIRRALEKRGNEDRFRFNYFGRAGEARTNLRLRGVREDRLREDEVELLPERLEIERVVVAERRLLDVDGRLAEFLANTGLDQPRQRLDAEITPR